MGIVVDALRSLAQIVPLQLHQLERLNQWDGCLLFLCVFLQKA